MLRVEVAYARPDVQRIVTVEVPSGATVATAIEASGIRAAFPEIDPQAPDVGIFAEPVDLNAPLADGDRVEIYRPLQADPKAQRRERARRQRAASRK